MGGIRKVQLWVEKPKFDHRPISYYCSLRDKETKEHHCDVWREHGWFASNSTSTRAKQFFKQDHDLRDKVMTMIRDSIEPKCPNEIRRADESHDLFMARVGDPHYENTCMVHEKRFLLEVDIRASTVILVKPIVIWGDEMMSEDLVLTPEQMTPEFYIEDRQDRPVPDNYFKIYDQSYHPPF